MVSLIDLSSYDNQFSGSLPESICDIYNNIGYLELHSNQFCPPYPNCLSNEDLGAQDTINCDFVAINNKENLDYSALHGIYPNPFNPITNIHYSVSENTTVTISVYDIKGKKIHSYAEMKKTKGNHSLQINGSQWVSGIYFVEMIADDYRSIKKLMLIK